MSDRVVEGNDKGCFSKHSVDESDTSHLPALKLTELRPFLSRSRESAVELWMMCDYSSH